MPHEIAAPTEPSEAYVARKRAAGLCINYRCASKAITCARCSKHVWQWRKQRDLIAYIFHRKKYRAAARGKSQPWGNVDGWGAWTITLDNFRDWCIATGYHLKTGRTASSMTLDRKDNRFGYHIWNLQGLTLAQNSAKSTLGEGGHYVTDAAGVTHYVFVQDGIEYPF